MIRKKLLATITDTASLTIAQMGEIIANKATSFTITVVAAATKHKGLWYKIINIGAGAVTVAEDGVGTLIILKQNESITIECDGTSWINPAMGADVGTLTEQELSNKNLTPNVGVGIAAASAQDAIHVYKSVAGTTGIRIENPDTTDSGTTKSGISLHTWTGAATAETFLLTRNVQGYGHLLNQSEYSGTPDIGLRFEQEGNYPIYFKTNSTDRITISGSGNVGIGTITPNSKLDVNGNIRLSGGTHDFIFSTDPSLATCQLQNQSSGQTTSLQLFTKDGDGTDDCNFFLYGVGTPDAWSVNYEAVRLKYENSTTHYELASVASGTGMVRPLKLYTGANTSQLVLATDGNVGIGIIPTEKLQVSGNIFLTTDSQKILFGTGKDMSLYYNGTDGYIKTDEVAPSDLHITCGDAKTLELDTPVYRDINVGGMILLKPAASAPDIDTFVDKNGDDTTIPTYAFAVDEYLSGGFEIDHDYKNGTNIIFHVHWQGIAAPTGTDNVQWRLVYTILRDDTPLEPAVAIDSPDTTFDTQYDVKRTDFAAIDGSGLLMGDQFMYKLYRVTATGDAYAGDALIGTNGLHVEVNTLGSRSITSK